MSLAHRARKIYRRVVADLGPPPMPVHFRAVDIDSAWGRTFKRPEYFLIEISKDHDGTFYDTVIHELAHVYAWAEGASFRGDHDEVWGVMYARVYCAAKGEH